MSAEWYYETDGQQQHGPVTAQQLKQLAVNGFLQPTHLVWKEGVPKKVPASAVKGLFTDLKKPAAEAPVKAPSKPTAASRSGPDDADPATAMAARTASSAPPTAAVSGPAATSWWYRSASCIATDRTQGV